MSQLLGSLFSGVGADVSFKICDGVVDKCKSVFFYCFAGAFLFVNDIYTKTAWFKIRIIDLDPCIKKPLVCIVETSVDLLCTSAVYKMTDIMFFFIRFEFESAKIVKIP